RGRRVPEPASALPARCVRLHAVGRGSAFRVPWACGTTSPTPGCPAGPSLPFLHGVPGRDRIANSASTAPDDRRICPLWLGTPAGVSGTAAAVPAAFLCPPPTSPPPWRFPLPAVVPPLAPAAHRPGRWRCIP